MKKVTFPVSITSNSLLSCKHSLIGTVECMYAFLRRTETHKKHNISLFCAGRHIHAFHCTLNSQYRWIYSRISSSVYFSVSEGNLEALYMERKLKQKLTSKMVYAAIKKLGRGNEGVSLVSIKHHIAAIYKADVEKLTPRNIYYLGKAMTHYILRQVPSARKLTEKAVPIVVFVNTSIRKLNEGSGVSFESIFDYIAQKYTFDAERMSCCINSYLLFHPEQILLYAGLELGGELERDWLLLKEQRTSWGAQSKRKVNIVVIEKWNIKTVGAKGRQNYFTVKLNKIKLEQKRDKFSCLFLSCLFSFILSFFSFLVFLFLSRFCLNFILFRFTAEEILSSFCSNRFYVSLFYTTIFTFLFCSERLS